jgi:hypothetical protein
MQRIARIDDISLNTDGDKLLKIVELLDDLLPNTKIMLGVSPLIFTMDENDLLKRERIFPSILNAFSDHRLYMKVNRAGVPDYLQDLRTRKNLVIASHGLVHVDHRLLAYEAQELSIITSCSLVSSNIFVPPFNKWNSATQAICQEAQIDLIKFEDGWKHLMHNRFSRDEICNFYFHTHDLGVEEFEKILRTQFAH